MEMENLWDPLCTAATGVHVRKTLPWLTNQNIPRIYPQWLTHDKHINQVNPVRQDYSCRYWKTEEADFPLR